MSSKRSLFLVIALLLFGDAFAQQALFLAIQGDGTASVIIDRARQAAWITDGGRSGSSGIRGARINSKPVLEYLLSQHIRILGVTCSHPHQDHMGGLEDTVVDPLMRQFDHILFVDNGIPEAESLRHKYEQFVGAEFAAAHSQYVNAAGVNAFADFLSGTGDVSVSNFEYNPGDVGNDVHDRSVIMQYSLNGVPPSTVVDFDDGSTDLINLWATKGGKATTIIYPHHGSRNNSIASLLENRATIGLQDVVLTVNRRNRFLHPSPEILLKLLEVLKPEHVFITDSDLGENVTIEPGKITDGRSQADHLGRLRDFVAARIAMHGAAVRRIMSNPFEEVRPDSEDDDSAPATLEVRLERNISHLKLSARQGNAIRRNIAALRAYRKALVLLGVHAEDEKTWVVGLFPGGDLDPPPVPSPTSVPPDKPSGGSGAYLVEAEKIGATAPNSNPSSSRAFTDEEATPQPHWGGIVLGNRVDGPVPRDLTFPSDFDGSADSVSDFRIHVVADDGEGDYVDATPEELWTAYNFVAPTDWLRGRYPKITGNMGGIVGQISHSEHSTDVALHPALAGTQLGWDAIYADDILIDAKHIRDQKPAVHLGPVFDTVPWEKYERFRILQWYDAPSRVVIRNGLVSVVPRTGSPSCLMRVRLAAAGSPNEELEAVVAFVDKKLEERAEAQGKTKEFKQAQEAAQATLSLSESFPTTSDKDKQEQQYSALKEAENQLWGRMRDAGVVSDTETEHLVREGVRQFESVKSQWKSHEMAASDVLHLCTGYRPLAEIDHLARLVALLNWYTSFGTRPLPSLPEYVRPGWRPTPDSWDERDSWFVEGHRVDGQ